ncbi:hypothetical protein QZH41_014361, partial [Actinostola sp. cb2023]
MADKPEEKDRGKSRGILSECLAKYSYFLRTRPVLTKSITSAITAGLGQLTSQKLRGVNDGKGLDYRALVAFSTF